ncbi:hypothetical protein BDP27DRAFT_1424795 [Rhodocollybia butyracea]|uniref:FBD domain-containing protein n=1 Tax=Rhodocollybia butyracea TaxID=206335 RepID=A0A9P5PKD3_9AGAR|nr:hypothetical protein BDP27DRAFT_1424795 [Rhodocollybia butyracea]
MLVAQGHRWRRAALVSVHPGNILFLLKHSATRFPLLEDFSYNSGTNITFLPAPFLEYHPPLQKLELSVLLKSDADAIASQSLKVLKIHRYCGGSLARLLHLCPCLEFLTLQSLDFREGSDDNLITCQSSLLALDIGGDLDNDRKVEHGAWTYVTLPKLTKLDVTLPDLVDIERWPEAAFEAGTSLSELKMVVKRSECPLQRVNLIVYAGYYNMEGKPELEVVEEFLEDFPVKAERCFVQDVPLQEWKAEILATVSDSSA